MFSFSARFEPSRGAPLDGRTDGRVLQKHVRPVLKAAGLDQFAGRQAWRRSEHTIDYVSFRLFTSYIAYAVGCTTYSFTGEVMTRRGDYAAAAIGLGARCR